jgi:SnoaL-like protein
MSDEDVILGAIEAWKEHGIEGLLEIVDPDVEWHAPPGFMEGEVWHGRDAVAPVLREQFGSVFRMVQLEPAEIVHGPGGWLIGGRVYATHDSGMNLDWTSYAVVHLEQGLVKRIWVFADREPAARLAGLDE